MGERATTHIAFLRAINVAGHAIVKMTDLKDAFVAAGCGNVRTFIQSGNVIFECPGGKLAAMSNKIRAKLRDLIRADPDVLIRTLADLQSIVKARPFKCVEGEALIKLYVVFLAEEPRTKPKLPLVSSKEALEAIAVRGREAFIVSRR